MNIHNKKRLRRSLSRVGDKKWLDWEIKQYYSKAARYYNGNAQVSHKSQRNPGDKDMDGRVYELLNPQ